MQRDMFFDILPGLRKDDLVDRVKSLEQSSSAWSDRDASPRSSRAQSSYESTVAQETRVCSATGSIIKTGLGKERRGYESPASDEEPDELFEIISKAMDTIIQKDSGWVDFFRARAAPQRVSEVLKHYRFVQRMMDQWVGNKAPFRTCQHVVEAVSATDPILHIDN
jgi:hypothetical protein